MTERFTDQHKQKGDLRALIDHFATFGATNAGGVERLAAGQNDKAARDFLFSWFEQHGFTTLIDEVGNLFGILELDCSQPDISVFCGSHLDSQPHGGRFDGALGVAYGCIAALALKELTDRGELSSAFRNFVVVCWTSEEGARFQPSLLGSRVFAGDMSVEGAWSCKDENGVSLKDALSKIGYLGGDSPPEPSRYLEVHIEQGPKLEEAGCPVGIVSGAWGARKLVLQSHGRADHTGPTPMDDREDALLAAAKLIIAVNDIAHETEDALHSSVGRIEVVPNSPNTVAETAEFWVEFRAGSEAVLDDAEDKLKAVVASIEQETTCAITEVNREVRPVVAFDVPGFEAVQNALERANISNLTMTTISGHDAVQLQTICPSTLLFVPSKDGISHSPDEFTSDEDIDLGFEATLVALRTLIAEPPQTSI